MVRRESSSPGAAILPAPARGRPVGSRNPAVIAPDVTCAQGHDDRLDDMQEVRTCAPGRRATLSYDVTDDDTALAMHSGDVAVLATPKVLALAEQAAVSALDGCLDAEHTTVGAWVEIDHLQPTKVGSTVTTEAVLIGVHGRRLEFSITVRDGDHEVAHVKHRRVIVERARFAA